MSTFVLFAKRLRSPIPRSRFRWHDFVRISGSDGFSTSASQSHRRQNRFSNCFLSCVCSLPTSKMATSPDSFMHPARSAMMRESRSPSLESSASKEEQYPDVIHGAPMERKPDVMGSGAELTLDLQAYGPRDPADYSRALSVATVRGRLNKHFSTRSWW